MATQARPRRRHHGRLQRGSQIRRHRGIKGDPKPVSRYPTGRATARRVSTPPVPDAKASLPTQTGGTINRVHRAEQVLVRIMARD